MLKGKNILIGGNVTLHPAGMLFSRYTFKFVADSNFFTIED